MIKGVEIHPLRQIPDERGKVMNMLRRDDPWFSEFGEICLPVVFPGAIKAGRLYKRMTLNYAVLSGRINLVLYDDRDDSPTRGDLQKILTGEDCYALVTVLPGLWNGFKGLGTAPAIVANCATISHDPNELVRLDPFSEKIPYRWEIRHG